MMTLKLLFSSIHGLLLVLLHNNIFHFNKLNKLRFDKDIKTLKILGNGKSLNENFSKLELNNVDYMVVNRFVLSESYTELKPKYYVIVDPYFFSNNEGKNIIKQINTTSWKIKIFLPYGHFVQYKIKKLFSKNKNIQLVFINIKEFNGFNFIKHFLYSHNLSLPKIQNVLVASIYAGICMGYNNIELYGVEHNWTKYLSVNDLNEVCLQNHHFFDKKSIEVKTWKEIQGTNAKTFEVLRIYSNMFESYWELQWFSKRKKVNILNCTPNSFIDAFPRKLFS